ncbi:MAG: SDR family NAD(P)-dependent oxidoreductase [Pseudomonadota bacterium]
MTTVITGAANGLGRALALAAAIRGDDILAVDHDEAALGELGLPSLALDLTAQDAAERLADAAAPISLIIHSAGISGTGPFEAIPAAHHARILKLNFEAPVAITCHLLAVSPGNAFRSGQGRQYYPSLAPCWAHGVEERSLGIDV